MPDREKVIKGLESCRYGCPGDECPYYDGIKCADMMTDALALLKEQEAVEPKPPETKLGTLWRCGSCGREIGFKYHFCQWCGRSVKWE